MVLTCPRCGWSNVRHSQMSGLLDHVMRLFLLSPYRCRCCRRRFYRYAGIQRIEKPLEQRPETAPWVSSPADAKVTIAPSREHEWAAALRLALGSEPEPLQESNRTEQEMPILCRLTFSQTSSERAGWR
jgi:hypothetical protein